MRYSEEIKQQARELCAQGLSKLEVGRRLSVSDTTVGRWVNSEVAERHRERYRQWYKQNPERTRERNLQWAQENPGYRRRWSQENAERQRENIRRWRQENSGLVREYCAFRRAIKKQATPPWLTKKHRKQIAALYTKARRLEKATGLQHQVDHIVPLVAKLNGSGEQIACGLHVPWNLQILPGSENQSKNCRLPESEHWTA